MYTNASCTRSFDLAIVFSILEFCVFFMLDDILNIYAVTSLLVTPILGVVDSVMAASIQEHIPASYSVIIS